MDCFCGIERRKTFEIFTGIADDDDGIMLPKSVTEGKIIKVKMKTDKVATTSNLLKKRFKITVEGLSI